MVMTFPLFVVYVQLWLDFTPFATAATFAEVAEKYAEHLTAVLRRIRLPQRLYALEDAMIKCQLPRQAALYAVALGHRVECLEALIASDVEAQQIYSTLPEPYCRRCRQYMHPVDIWRSVTVVTDSTKTPKTYCHYCWFWLQSSGSRDFGDSTTDSGA